MSDAPQLRPPPEAQRQAEETRIKDEANRRGGETEFQAQWGLGAVNAHWAYARGATGNDVIIGVIDGGVDHKHREVDGKITSNSILFHPNGVVGGLDAVTSGHPYPVGSHTTYTGIPGGYPIWELCPNELRPRPLPSPSCQHLTAERDSATPPIYRIPFARETIHGLGNVSLIAGRRNNGPNTDGDIHGIAYDSRIRFSIEYLQPGLGTINVNRIPTEPFLHDLLIPLIISRVPVVNLSLGLRQWRIDDPEFSMIPALREVMAQQPNSPDVRLRRSPGERTVTVWAAGNDNGDVCDVNRRISNTRTVARHGCIDVPDTNGNGNRDEKLEALRVALNLPPVEMETVDELQVRVNARLAERGFATDLANLGIFDAAVPAPEGGYPYLAPELRGHVLTVAATRRDDPVTTTIDEEGISGFSNRCGSLPAGWVVADHGRHYCLAAPGEGILLPLPRRLERVNPDGSMCTSRCTYLEEDGTSLAAPHVTGAIAVLIDFFTDDRYQNVGNTAIVRRILETANRKGVYAGDATDCVGTLVGDDDDPDRECTGDAAYTKTYGAGLLDLKAATEPIDPPVMTTGASLSGPARPLSQTRLSAGPAYGDAFARAFAGTRVAAFDSMLFPFWHPLTSLVDSPPQRNIYYHRARFSPPSRIATHLPGVGTFRLGVKTLPPIPRRAFRRPDATDPARRRPSSLSFRRETASGSVFAAWRSPGSTPLSLRETLPTPLSSDAFTHPFMSLADNGISVGVRAGALTAAAFTDPDAPSPVHGMALDYALLPYLSAQAGMVSEKGGALGLRPAGAFGGLSTTSTAFTGLKLDAPVSPRWRVLSHAHFGTARPDVSGIGLVKEVSPLLVSAVSVGIAGRGVLTDGDSLTLAVSQPLRVERGRVSLVVPTGRTPDGDLRRVGIDAGLAPSGREVTLSAAWTAAVGRAAYVRLAAGASREPGHDASADNAFHALADVSFRF